MVNFRSLVTLVLTKSFNLRDLWSPHVSLCPGGGSERTIVSDNRKERVSTGQTSSAHLVQVVQIDGCVWSEELD